MEYHPINLAEALGLGSKELVSIVGGGGKTSLMRALTGELTGRVVAASTTRLALDEVSFFTTVIMYIPEGKGQASLPGIEARVTNSEPQLFAAVLEALKRGDSCLVTGARQGEKVAGVPVEIPGRLLRLEGVDCVIVEADGSRRLPCKAPAAHEPVIPEETTTVVPMAGIDAVGMPLIDIAHRPELVSAITGLKLEANLTAEALAKLLSDPMGGTKGAPSGARVVPFINKVQDDALEVQARIVARLMLEQERIDRVLLGAVQSDPPVREVHRRITGVILAAGRSQRMGSVKQLLPWGSTTVLGHTIKNLAKSLVTEVLVVTGYQAQAVNHEAARHGVQSVLNYDYKEGGMISSLQTALRSLPGNREAILVMLADQPMIDSVIIDKLVSSWLKGRGELVAPSFRGRRGNPVIFGKKHFEELLSLPPGSAPRKLLQGRENEMVLIDVDSKAILYDLDSLDDYRRWRPASGDLAS